MNMSSTSHIIQSNILVGIIPTVPIIHVLHRSIDQERIKEFSYKLICCPFLHFIELFLQNKKRTISNSKEYFISNIFRSIWIISLINRNFLWKLCHFSLNFIYRSIFRALQQTVKIVWHDCIHGNYSTRGLFQLCVSCVNLRKRH